MFPGLDPKKMQAVMKQMGISQNEIDASRVIIETPEKNIIINNPSVTKIKMQGQESFQITGDISEEEAESSESSKEEDIQTIIEKTNCTLEEAEEAWEKAGGDLAEAILELS
ncbi:MAG: nascent polypeptide-associated complex protein [Candidatus Pacearchaeota archaeon]